MNVIKLTIKKKIATTKYMYPILLDCFLKVTIPSTNIVADNTSVETPLWTCTRLKMNNKFKMSNINEMTNKILSIKSNFRLCDFI